MELEVSGSKSDFDDNNKRKNLEGSTGDRIRVKKKTLQAVLEQCQRSLESLNDSNGVDEDESDEYEDGRHGEVSGYVRGDREADKLCDLLKSRVECHDFLEKLEDAQASVPLNTFEECSSWDVVSDVDLWESGDALDQEGYIVVQQEDIVDGIACFMAAYLLSLKETKELSPNQLQNEISYVSLSPKERHSNCWKLVQPIGPLQNILNEEEKRKTPEGVGWKQGHL